MTDSSKAINGEIQPNRGPSDPANTDAGRTILVGVLGGIISAAGYLVYQRLPDEQKDRLHRQVRGLVESRINELRSNFNI
jgi:predicted site-specific integrase-resolvase